MNTVTSLQGENTPLLAFKFGGSPDAKVPSKVAPKAGFRSLFPGIAALRRSEQNAAVSHDARVP